MSGFDLRAAIQAEIDEPGHVTKDELRAVLAAYDASLQTPDPEPVPVAVSVRTSWGFAADPAPAPPAYPGVYGEGSSQDGPASYPELYGMTTGA